MKTYWKSLEELKDIQEGSNLPKKDDPEFSTEGLTETEVSNKLKSKLNSEHMISIKIFYSSICIINGNIHPLRKF